MTHKDAPPETATQSACRAWWTAKQPHVKRAWGRAKDGYFFAEESRLLHEAWEAAMAEAMAEIEALRKDAERLDYLDRSNAPIKMGWSARKGPAGNVSVTSVIFLGRPVVSIRSAIDAAMASGVKS